MSVKLDASASALTADFQKMQLTDTFCNFASFDTVDESSLSAIVSSALMMKNYDCKALGTQVAAQTKRVKKLCLCSGNFAPGQLEALAPQFPNVKEFCADASSFDDSCLRVLRAHFKGLDTLSLRKTKVTTSALFLNAGQFKALKSIDLRDNPVDPKLLFSMSCALTAGSGIDTINGQPALSFVLTGIGEILQEKPIKAAVVEIGVLLKVSRHRALAEPLCDLINFLAEVVTDETKRRALFKRLFIEKCVDLNEIPLVSLPQVTYVGAHHLKSLSSIKARAIAKNLKRSDPFTKIGSEMMTLILPKVLKNGASLFLASLLDYFPNCTTLNVSGTLQITNGSGIDIERVDLSAKLYLASKLRTLDLTGCKVDIETIRNIVVGLPKLVHLRLCNTDATDETLKEIAGKMNPDLVQKVKSEVLNEDDCVRLAHDEQIKGGLKQLEVLEVDGCKQITGAGLEYAASFLPKLERLSATDCPKVTAEVLRELAPFITGESADTKTNE